MNYFCLFSPQKFRFGGYLLADLRFYPYICRLEKSTYKKYDTHFCEKKYKSSELENSIDFGHIYFLIYQHIKYICNDVW